MGEMQISTKTLKSYIHKLRVDGNCILLIKANTPLASDENIEKIMAAARTMNLGNPVMVAIVDDFDEIQTLNKMEMQRYGWFRREDIAKLFKIPAKR